MHEGLLRKEKAVFAQQKSVTAYASLLDQKNNNANQLPTFLSMYYNRFLAVFLPCISL
jgi:hypothetical protein